MRRLLPVLLLLALFAGGAPARAETAARLRLYGLKADSFPTLTASMDVFDASGAYVTGLTPAQVTLLEDGVPITPAGVEDIQPGVQFAVALDAGAAFAFRGTDAVSRLDKVRLILQSWAGAHADAYGDDLSLVPNAGRSASHLANSGAFLDALAAYQPDLGRLASSLDTLSLALDVVTDRGMDNPMKRVVLYITSPPERAAVETLQNLTQRAVSLDVRVHVWIVASPDYFRTSGATALKDLSILTGGSYALFSGSEPLPDPEAYLTPLRHAYLLTWESAIRSAGAHNLAVQAALGDGTLTSEPIAFNFNIQPPNPILVSPPAQIVRQGPDLRASDFSTYLPARLEVEAILEFPDGMERPLARTALYVDGVLVDENTEEPFDRFTWDLSGYTRSGEHILQLQARDSLGLERTSLGLTVTVTVIQPERGLMSFLARNNTWVVVGAVTLAGAVLVVTLAMVGRKRAVTSRRRGGRGQKRIDPLTAPVESIAEEKPRRPLKRRAAASIQQAEAWLQRLREDGQPVTAPPIPIVSPEIIFGSDPLRATRLLDEASVSPVHARLKVENGVYLLSDEKSIAGTWVNHEMLTAPRRLQHGDLLQMGRIRYRFMLRQPPATPTPRLRLVKK